MDPMLNSWTVPGLKEQIHKFHVDTYRWSVLSPPLSLYRRAAVLVPLFIKDGDIHVWLTKRSQSVGADKGHVSFPGGMKDPHDADEIATCLREANEEIGLETRDVEIVAHYLPRMNARKIFFTPVVGIVSENFVPVPNIEVAVAFEVPLGRFLSCDQHHHEKFVMREKERYVHFFQDFYDDEHVTTWGITANVCIEIAVALLQKATDFDFSPSGKLLPDFPFASHMKDLSEIESRPFESTKL